MLIIFSCLYIFYILCSLKWLSYKRLTPEEVHFSGAALLDSDEMTDTDLKEENPELPLFAPEPSLLHHRCPADPWGTYCGSLLYLAAWNYILVT